MIRKESSLVHNWLDFHINHMSTNTTPGLQVEIFDGGKTVLRQSYGYADLEEGRPLTNEDTFACGSVTKSLAVVEVLRAVNEGKISLDTKLVDVLAIKNPGDPRLRDITLEQLISHTSGLPYGLTVPGAFEGPSLEDGPIGDDEFLAALAEIPLLDNPGASLGYSNSGISTAVLMTEEATGETFENLVGRNVFTPLGMENSRIEGEAPVSVRTYTRLGKKACELERLGVYARSSGLQSNAEDLTKLGSAFLGGRPEVVSEENVAYMRQHPHKEGKKDHGPGRGIYRDADGIALYGIRSRCAVQVKALPEMGRVVTALTNQNNQVQLSALRQGIEQLYSFAKNNPLETEEAKVYATRDEQIVSLIAPLEDGRMASVDVTQDSPTILTYKPVDDDPTRFYSEGNPAEHTIFSMSLKDDYIQREDRDLFEIKDC